MTLQEAIRAALPYVAGKSTLPILSHVLMDQWMVIACDLTVEAVFQTDGSAPCPCVAVPAGRIEAVLDIIDASTVSADGKGAIIIRNGRSRYRIPALPANDFPRIAADGVPEALVTMPAKELAERLLTALVAAAKGDIRHYLNGVFIERRDAELHVVATDGHRIIAQRVDSATVEGGDFGVILPREAIGKIAKTLAADDGDVRMSILPKVIHIAAQETLLTVKRVEGQYPDWRRLNAEHSPTAIVDAGALADAVNRASRYVNEEFHGVRIVIDGGELAIDARDEDGGEACVIIQAETFAKTSLSINIDYLRDAIKTAGNGSVGIYAKADDTPVRVEPHPRRDGYMHAIAQMRL